MRLLAIVLLAGCFPGGGLLDTPAAEPSPRIAAALKTAQDAAQPERDRVNAVRRLGRGDYDTVSATLFQLLAPAQPDPLRIEAVRALEELAQPRAVAPLLHGWTNCSAPIKQQVLHSLTSHRELAGEFVAQLERGTLPLAEVDAGARQRLAVFPDEAIAAKAAKIFERQPYLDARAALQRFRPALALKGDAARGKEVFKERTCVNCHRIGDEGHFVGADLFTIKDMARDELLQQIVAPNLFFMPTFQAFVAETPDGELLEGVVAGTTETTVTIRQALGIDRVFNKTSLKRLKGLNVSLMPEGLLEGLAPQQVADLLEFIRSLRGF
ncbi:MAG: c-type cytochrome [Verrucomicrobia bacterium]|nr:c-type cytochrome [Verrucomicrobiota bacterium]